MWREYHFFNGLNSDGQSNLLRFVWGSCHDIMSCPCCTISLNSLSIDRSRLTAINLYVSRSRLGSMARSQQDKKIRPLLYCMILDRWSRWGDFPSFLMEVFPILKCLEACSLISNIPQNIMISLSRCERACWFCDLFAEWPLEASTLHQILAVMTAIL